MAPMPTYHWCPGDYWDPGWGNNWYGDGCHDDHHRDMDYNNHDHDYWGDNGPVGGVRRRLRRHTGARRLRRTLHPVRELPALDPDDVRPATRSG